MLVFPQLGMSDLSEITLSLRANHDLTDDQCTPAAMALTRPEVASEDKKAFLEALHEKGETVAEVTAFARVFRQLASDPQLSDIAPEAIDIVGTGGSGSKGFNVSSVTAMLVAASGCKVLKHGNRAVTSQSGAADFLGEIGIRMDTDPALLREAITELNFCFFFAPAFHPAFKEIVPVRKELAMEGKRTVFNILGPLINPAKPMYQLLGVFSPKWVSPLAEALHHLGLTRGLAVCCELKGGGYMDELTTAGHNHVAGLGGLAEESFSWNASDLGFPPANPAALQGGTAAENVALFEDILTGRGKPEIVDALVLNAAAAFLIVGKVDTVFEGCSLAREILLGGTLRTWLDKARAFYRAKA